MTKERSFSGTVKAIDGVKRFVPNYPALWQHRLNKCKDGQVCEIDFRENKKIRSLRQNNLYWLYLGVIEAETGNEIDDLHRLFKKKFLPWKIKNMYGEQILQLTSTTELTSDEFTEYLMKIERLTGIPIPDVKGYAEERDSAPLL